ncbi:tetratricopeptide repeat protein [Ruegeria sp. Alg231-54]|uniref:tetratricopeptide repeat protein n=1 Tax=Ruegeria sp. Alg231-54 TaxID=1922221 RepID=UPI00131F412B|nr:tetratricopeptide repeat protein [Ruegeria sp. Alg231-54]
MLQKAFRGVALGVALILLVACDSAEERAEKHFQAALEYLENGDFARATIEFRNVFKLNGKHKEARLTYAKMRRDAGNVPEAYGQYLRLVEQYPDNLEGRRALAQMAALSGDWEEAERHVGEAAEQAPEDTVVRAVLASLAYREALEAEDEAAMGQAVEQAEALIVEAPELVIPHFIVVNDWGRQQRWPEALEALAAALAVSPETRRFHDIRLAVLGQLGRDDETEAALEEMVERFPADPGIQSSLISWYMARNDLEATESFLRRRIDPDEDDPQNRMALLQFLAGTSGPDAAIAEIDRMLAGELAHRPLYQALRAGQRFEAGATDAAIAELQAVIAASEPSADLNDARVVLAHMLLATNDEIGARALVDEVLAADTGHVGAVKLRAGWLIGDDRTGDAIVLLRAALGDSPRDAELMTLLANAHQRDGNRDLMAEMLSLAVEASGSAPEESLRYAEYLVREDNANLAAGVLTDALGRQPGNVQLLTRLGQIHILGRDWRSAQKSIDRLEAQGDGTAAQVQALTAGLLAAQGYVETLMSYLEDLSDEGGSVGDMAEIGIVRAHVRNDDLEAAQAYLDRALEDAPEDVVLRFLQASVLAGMGKQDQAVAVYRTLLEERPKSERTWIALYVLLSGTDTAQADEVLGQALSALPDSAALKWIKAGALEAQGDIEGAIDVYEALYKADSNSVVVANNLASLLVAARDDAESLDQAYRIARRLRNSQVPHFSDTYGWIAYRRGDYDAALKHLEFAARQLPGEPTVLYHLGATYAALSRNTEARATLEKVTELEQVSEDLAQKIQAAIADLTTPAENGN